MLEKYFLYGERSPKWWHNNSHETLYYEKYLLDSLQYSGKEKIKDFSVYLGDDNKRTVHLDRNKKSYLILSF